MPNAPLLVGGSPAAEADMPPVDYYDLGSGSEDSDSDRHDDHPLDEPQFVFHAVDDDDRPHPPIQHNHHHPAPALQAAAAAEDRVYLHREAAGLERLNYFLILPQAILCIWIVVLGILMISEANNPGYVFFSLGSLVLTLLAVYCYDGWPCLNGWLR